MTKHAFLGDLLESLSALPEAERDKAYAFYAEIIDDSIDDGMSEEEAVARLGSLDEIVDHIVAETPISVLLKSTVKRRTRGAANIWMLVLGFPVWFPVLVTVAALLLTLYILLWVMDLVLWVVCGSGAAAALGGVVAFLFAEGASLRLMYLGTALAGAGMALLLFPASLQVTKRFARLSEMLWKQIKNRLFMKRSGNV